MKIGIMTFWKWPNYGSLLQCYALQKYLRDAGHDAYLIRYDLSGDIKKKPIYKKILMGLNPFKLWNFFIGRWLKLQDRHRNFESFLRVYIKQSVKTYHSYNELRKDPPEADVYIVGSDQVWGFPNDKLTVKGTIIDNIIRAFHLDFGNEKIRKIAWAVSYGKEIVSESHIQKITPLLESFEYIGVREKSGLKICARCGIKNTEWVADPTLLLDADAYRFLYKDESMFVAKPKCPYCFLYLLDNIPFSVKKIYKWAATKGLGVVYITGNAHFDRFKKMYATIPEWIYLLENAEYVITNSFHATVFSLIFNKKFSIIPRIGSCESQNERFRSLFTLLGIEQRYNINNLFSDEKTDWESVNNNLRQLKNACKLNTVICVDIDKHDT